MRKKRAPARRRRAPAALPAPPVASLAVVTLTRITSGLTADIRKAAAADAAYAALLAAPPLGREVLGGLLFDDGRLCVPNDPAHSHPC